MHKLLLLLGLAAATVDLETRAESDAAVGFAYSLIGPRVVNAGPPTASPATASMQQLDRIRDLGKSTAWPADYAEQYLKSLRAGPKKTFSEMSGEEADRLIVALEKYQASQAKKAKTSDPVPASGGCSNGSCGVRRGWFR